MTAREAARLRAALLLHVAAGAHIAAATFNRLRLACADVEVYQHFVVGQLHHGGKPGVWSYEPVEGPVVQAPRSAGSGPSSRNLAGFDDWVPASRRQLFGSDPPPDEVQQPARIGNAASGVRFKLRQWVDG